MAAFTLAEVLITLGVIGVVAAMTLPTLMSNYRKHVVETKLAKFYSTINQALKLAEVDYGDMKGWDVWEKGYELDEEDNPDMSKPKSAAFFKKYLEPYINAQKIEPLRLSSDTKYTVYFNDGSVAVFGPASIHFYVNNKYLTITHDDETYTSTYDKSMVGTQIFTFLIDPSCSLSYRKYHCGKGLEPFKQDWNGDIAVLKNHSTLGCNETASNERAYCTALIQMNGWKIPKDYPLKF